MKRNRRPPRKPKRRPDTARQAVPGKRNPGVHRVAVAGAPAFAATFAVTSTATSAGDLARLAFNDAPRLAAGLLLLAALAFNIANVVARYGMGRSIYWADEAMVFLVVWSVCLAGISVAWRGAHLNMDMLVEALPRQFQVLAAGLVAVVTVVMFSAMAWIAGTVVAKFYGTGQRSVALGLPMVVPHLALLLGFGLSALAIVVRLAIDGRLVPERTLEDRLEKAL